MFRTFRRTQTEVGLPPGVLPRVGEKPPGPVPITVIEYNREMVREETIGNLEELAAFRDRNTVSWINVDGIHDTKLLERLGAAFGLHPLIVEDIATFTQRPKAEEYDDYLCVVLKMIRYDSNTHLLDVEQISLLLIGNCVLTLQERPGDVLGPVRQRIHQGKGRIRTMGADYLLYALVDAIVDNYFVMLESIGEAIVNVEDSLMDYPTPDTLRQIHGLKTNVIFLRRSIWPVREVISSMTRNESGIISPETGVFVRDAYDHTIQVIETVETYRDVVTGLFDIYLSSVSNRMNEIMKLLTIIATIFIPLTFIAGVYGMNFEYMPELRVPWAYPGTLLAMFMVAIGLLAFFKKKGWL